MSTKLDTVNLKGLLEMDIPECEMIINPILTTGGLLGLFAMRGIGKTFLSLEIAYCVANGMNIFGNKWTVMLPRKVVFIDGEMTAWSVKDRLRQIHERRKGEYIENLEIFNHNIYDIRGGASVQIDLMNTEYQNAVDVLLNEKDAGLLILDNLSCLSYSGKENEADSWGVMQQWLLRLKKKGISTIFVHHVGKGGEQRGTSRREDALDTVIKLEKAKSENGGCAFKIGFEKTRHFHGEDTREFSVKLDSEAGFVIIAKESDTHDKKKKINHALEEQKRKRIIHLRNSTNELTWKKNTYDDVTKVLKNTELATSKAKMIEICKMYQEGKIDDEGKIVGNDVVIDGVVYNSSAEKEALNENEDFDIDDAEEKKEEEKITDEV